MSQLILIDGDILTYQIAFSVEFPIYVCKSSMYKRRINAEKASQENGFPVHKRMSYGSESEIRRNLDNKLKQICYDCSSVNYKIYITDSDLSKNYRTKIATLLPYKGNRKNLKKPFHYDRLRNILMKDYKAIMISGEEADDAMGIEQIRHYHEKNDFNQTVIATIDKDLRGVPGYHYHLDKRVTDFIPPDKAMKNFYEQMLRGDTIDNIPGLVKILKLNGRDEEAKQLQYSWYIKDYLTSVLTKTPEECYDLISGLYYKYGLGKSYIDEIGNLLWIRQEEGEIWSKGKHRGVRL